MPPTVARGVGVGVGVSEGTGVAVGVGGGLAVETGVRVVVGIGVTARLVWGTTSPTAFPTSCNGTPTFLPAQAAKRLSEKMTDFFGESFCTDQLLIDESGVRREQSSRRALPSMMHGNHRSWLRPTVLLVLDSVAGRAEGAVGDPKPLCRCNPLWRTHTLRGPVFRGKVEGYVAFAVYPPIEGSSPTGPVIYPPHPC